MSDDGPAATGGDPIVVKLLNEINQAPGIRQALMVRIQEKLKGRCVLVFFTSFTQPVMIDEADADIIEGVLQKSDLKRGLTMVVNSPGGDGLAAERIINVCRSYSGGNFEAIVPKMAKSAATMICFGANKVSMGATSELGAIDPQVFRANQLVSAHSIITSYEDLLSQAVGTKGNVEPYLQQLARYDATEIQNLRAAQKLSESIAVNALHTGMMREKTEDEIKASIDPFMDPEFTSAHARRIGMDVAAECGLMVGKIRLDSELWELLWELYVRSDWYVSFKSSKMVETKAHAFEFPMVRRPAGGPQDESQ